MNYHAQRQHTVIRTLVKMLQRRGYTVPPEVEARTQADVEGMYATSATPPLDFTAHRSGTPLMVLFLNDVHTSKLGLAPIRDLVAAMTAKNCVDALLVVHDGLTAPAASMVRELETKSGITLTTFHADTLLYDIWEHAAVPKHTLLTNDERESLLATFKCTEDQLPRMMREDPMARYMGLRVGDVVRIERPSVTVGMDIYYRIVVEPEE